MPRRRRRFNRKPCCHRLQEALTTMKLQRLVSDSSARLLRYSVLSKWRPSGMVLPHHPRKSHGASARSTRARRRAVAHLHPNRRHVPTGGRQHPNANTMKSMMMMMTLRRMSVACCLVCHGHTLLGLSAAKLALSRSLWASAGTNCCPLVIPRKKW